MGGRLRSPGLLLAAFLLEGGAAAMAAGPTSFAPALAPPPSSPPPAPAPPASSPPPAASHAIPPARNAPPIVHPPPSAHAAPPRQRLLRRKEIVLILPFVGIHSYQHAEAFNTDPGLRFGSLLGGRLNDRVSLNGELRFDFTNPGPLPAGTDVSEYAYSVTFSPLVQVPTGGLELVLGPKVGIVFVSQQFSEGTTREQVSGFGLVLGANAGVFVPVSAKTSLGVLLSFELAKPYVVCNRDSASCDTTSAVPSSKSLGLTAAVVF